MASITGAHKQQIIEDAAEVGIDERELKSLVNRITSRGWLYLNHGEARIVEDELAKRRIAAAERARTERAGVAEGTPMATPRQVDYVMDLLDRHRP